MEGGGGILGRVSEKILVWIGLALLLLLGFGLYQMGPDGRGALLRGIGYTIFWIVLVAALPWTATLFIKRLMEVGENWIGIVLIAGFTLIDVVVGLVLVGGWPTGVWSWLAALAALGVVGTYNFLVCEYLADQSGL